VKRGVLLCVVSVLALSACGSSDPSDSAASPSAAAAIRVDAVPKAALSLEDMGEGWSRFDVASVEGCTKIGGKICAEDVPGRVSTKIEVGYNQGDSNEGFVANTILLMAVEEDARKAVDAFRAAARTKRWNQSFTAGDATYELSPLEFDRQGDETIAYRILSTATGHGSDRSASRQIDYIVFRSGRVISFLYVIKAESAPIARKSAEKIEALVSGEL
jgi:hypothetical protein